MGAVHDTCNVVLYFSLPFKPKGTANPFFNGHIALSLDRTVYHIVNPTLLRTGFLFSVMPADDWLFGSAGSWVERDPASPQYRHVYLYRKNETTRTAVFGAGMQVPARTVTALRNRIEAAEQRFISGSCRYDFLMNNCSSIIARILADEHLVGDGWQNGVPVLFFKRFLARNRRKVLLWHLSEYNRTLFSVRRFCFGLWSFNPEKVMVRLMEQGAQVSVL